MSASVPGHLLVTDSEHLVQIVQTLSAVAKEFGWDVVVEDLAGTPVSPREVQKRARRLRDAQPLRLPAVIRLRIVPAARGGDGEPVDARRLLQHARRRAGHPLTGVVLDVLTSLDPPRAT